MKLHLCSAVILSFLALVVLAAAQTATTASPASSATPQEPPSVKPLKPFTAEVPAIPATVTWDTDKVRLDMGAFTADGGTVSPHYSLLFYKTGTVYQVFPDAPPMCSYDVVPPEQVACHNPLSMLLMPLPAASAKTKITVLGEETVAGVPCTVEQVTSSDLNIAPSGGVKLWISKDLGITVKVASPGADGSSTLFDKIKLGKPDPQLFVPPAYCKLQAGSAGKCN
jgi:hypothetical protein